MFIRRRLDLDGEGEASRTLLPRAVRNAVEGKARTPNATAAGKRLMALADRAQILARMAPKTARRLRNCSWHAASSAPEARTWREGRVTGPMMGRFNSVASVLLVNLFPRLRGQNDHLPTAIQAGGSSPVDRRCQEPLAAWTTDVNRIAGCGAFHATASQASAQAPHSGDGKQVGEERSGAVWLAGDWAPLSPPTPFSFGGSEVPRWE